MSDKMREEFGKHCHLWRYIEEVDENGFFTNPTTQRAWDVWAASWQASRAALVVELPEYEFSNHHRNILIDEVKSSLDAAGVKYE